MINLYKKLFKKPYKLKVASDTGNGVPVIFLHGIASDSSTWKYVLPKLPETIRPIAIDLLGFGQSPKPTWPKYSLDDHAKSVAYTIKKLGINKPVTIVGHSMGGLIAIELANKNPSLVKNLILAGVPLYANKEVTLAVKQYKSGKHTTNALFTAYEKLLDEKQFTLKGASKIMKVSPNVSSFILSEQTWLPFKKSLKNSIMSQDSIKTVSKLNVPIIFFYGLIDPLIIADHYGSLAKSHSNITKASYASGHMVIPTAAKKISNKIITTNKPPLNI